jgi:hypothetical protein
VKAVRNASVLAVTINGRSSSSARAGSTGTQNETRCVRQEKGHGLSRDVLSRHHQIAFVLAIFIVDNDDHASSGNCRDGLFDAG